MATGGDNNDISEPLSLMETEGIETVHSSFKDNAVAPEGGSFFEPPSIAKVPAEETCRKQIDQVPMELAEKERQENEKQKQKDEGFDITEAEAAKENAVVDETKKIAEKGKQVNDVTGTILQIEEPCLNTGEEEKTSKHVEAIENREAEVEGKPKSTEKEIGGPEKNEEEARKIEENVELETSKDVSSFDPSLSQFKEAQSQTPSVTANNLDNLETVKDVCLENKSKDSGTDDKTGVIDEQHIAEERFEGAEEKSESCSRFSDENGPDEVKAIEEIENEKEGSTCDTIGGGTSIVGGIDIRNDKEAISEIGECVQDKLYTEDIATVAHKTQEKQTEEVNSQQVNKPDICIVSETESEEIVKSPEGGGQTVILEKTAEAGSRGGENINDEMHPEQKHDGLFVKHEERKHSTSDDLAMGDKESKDIENHNVVAADNNTSDAVPITISTVQEHSTIAEEDKIMDAVTTTAPEPEHSKEESSNYEDKMEEKFAQQDEAENEKIENSLKLISGEIDTATSSECSEEIVSAKEDTNEEKPIDADANVDNGLPIEKGLLPTDLNEKIEDAELKLQNKNASELHVSHSLEQETILAQGKKQPKVFDFEPQEANGLSTDLEKHVEDAFEACESIKNTNLGHLSAEGAITTEVRSKASEMYVEKVERVHELESEEKLEIDDAGTNLEEEMQKEETHDEHKQTCQMATTSGTIEEVSSYKVCRRELVDKKVEHSVQAAGLQEAETLLRNEVEQNHGTSNIINEELNGEPKIKDIGEVIDEEKIKDDTTHLSSEVIHEKVAESSQDNEMETELSKEEYVEEQKEEDENTKVILQESIQEASVSNFQNDGKIAEKSSREMYEVSEAATEVETNNNDESPDSTLPTSPLKEHESQQTENLTVAAEEKDEDRSSIRDEDEENNSGLKEIKECSEQETLKGEYVEQMLPKNEQRENLEHSASMISAGTEEGALNEMTQTTEEEIVEGVEDVKKEAEMGKEDGEEHATDETNTKSASQESIKEVPVSILPNDEKNAEEFKGEIFEESVTAGTNDRIAHAMYQNDENPNTALQISTVKEVEIVQGEGKDTSPAEASPEEESEHDWARGLKRVEDTSSEVRLEQDLEKSDEESSKTIDAVSHGSNQHTEFPISTLEISPVEEQASLQRDKPTPAETSLEEKKYEDGSSTKKDEDNEKNTGLAEETHDAGETLKAEENLEQILQNYELKENPEQSITMICVETETDAFTKMVDNHEDEIVEIPRGNAEAELHKEEDGEGHVIEKSKITSLSQESAEEGLTKNFQNAAKNSEKSIKEMFESQIAGGDEDCNSSLPISLVKREEIFKGEDKNTTPAEAPPHDEKEQHGSLDRAGEGNDSNPELLVTNQDSVRETLKVEEDFEQELQKIGPGESEEPSTVMAAETEAGTLSDKIDEITSPEEVFAVQNIEETVEKEKKEGSEDTDVTEVKKVVMEEDLKLVAEASDANKSVDNDVEEENTISGGKEVETHEKTFELGSIKKLEVEEERENMDEEIKHEGIKEVYGDTKLASLSVDAGKHITTEEHTSTDISPQTIGEKTAEEKAKTEKEMREELVITSANEDIEKKVPEEESAINDQSRIIYEGDETRMLVELEVHEIIQTTEKYEDIGQQGSVIEDNFEVPLSGTNEENPLHKETKDVTDKVKPNDEVGSNSEFTEPIEANKSPIEISSLESKSKEILQEVKPDVNDSSSTTITGITRELSFKEEEPEDERQIESFEPAHQEKGPVTKGTERTLETVDIDAKPENASNFIENKDHGIPAASGAEEVKNEIYKETAIMGSEDNKEETINEMPLGNILDDKQKCSTMLSKESELMTNEGSKTIGENSTTYENRETPQTPQETEIMLKEDAPINARDASISVDSKIESINEEVRSYQFDNLNEHHELDNEKQEGREISKLEEVRDLANQGASKKLMSLEDEDSSNVGDEALKHIEAISAERKEAILEEENSTKKSEDSLTEDVEANKAAFELESGTNNQKQAIGNKDFEVLVEENFEVAETGKKLEGVSETETRDQSSGTIPEIDPGKVENMIEIQNENTSESMEQSSQESREVQKGIEEKTELKFEAPGDVKETQNADETVKDVILTEEVHKVKKADSEALNCTEKDLSDTSELYAKSTEDERVREVKESSLASSEYHKATESNEQTAIVSSDVQEAPTMEEMSVAKAIEDEDSEMPAVLSTATPAKESEEIIKIMEEEDKCCDNIKETTMAEITKTILEEAQLDEQMVQASTIISNDSISHTIEAEACQQEKNKDNMALELHSSNLASQIPNDDHENITREHVAQENADADDVQENKRASDVVYESKGHGIDELNTSKITEEIEKSSEVVESQGAEATTNEVATDETLPEVIPKEEKEISPTTERMEEKMKGVEVLADHPKITEDVPLQKEDFRERDLSQLELQSNKDIPNQSPNEVLEEQCGTPDETKEEIKGGPELVSITDSQGFEAPKEDASTSAQTVLEEKLEEQNQTLSVALLSRERDCGAETTIENIEEYGQEVEIPADPQNSSSPKTTEVTCLRKEVTNELEVSGLGVELDTGMQKDSLNQVQVEESKIPDDASKLQTPEYETSKEASESLSEVHGHKDLAESEETEIKEKHPELAITDLAGEENQYEEIIDATEVKHDEVIEAGTFGRTSNLRTEKTKEAFKSISAVHGHEVLAESEDTESKEKDPEVAVTDMAAKENQSERTIDATEIIHDEFTNKKIMEEKEDANHSDPVTLGEETTKESQEEYELKAEESLRDKGTAKNIQNEELFKEVEKANGYERIEKQMDTERIIEHLRLAAVENETIKETCLDKADVKNVKEAGSELHLENQSIETTSGNDGRTEVATVKEERIDVEISQKEGPTDLVEANEATQEIHEGEKTSKTATEHIEEHVKEVEIEVDEHPQDSSPKTTENTCLQKEEIKEQEVCGLGVECNKDMQTNASNEFDKEEGRTSDEDSTLQPQGYENKIKEREYPTESEKMTEITETGAFEKTSDLRTETSEEAFKSVSEVHEHEVLAASEVEYNEIKKEKDTEVAVPELVAGENQNEKTMDATEIMHNELTNEELTKQDKQQVMEEKKDAKNCSPITLGEETTKESHQIFGLKAEESQEDKTAKEFQREEVSNERTSEYLHQTAVEDETIKESFPDEALVKNAEDTGTKLQVENQSDEEISAYDRTEATTITNKEFGGEISEKESLQAPADVNENTQDIHQGGRDSNSTSDKPISIEAEPQETRERKKDAPQGLLQEPLVEATQSVQVGESQPANAIEIVDSQGPKHGTEKSIDENNRKEADETMSAKISLLGMMQKSTREREVGRDVKEEKEANACKEATRLEGEETKSDEEEGEEHKQTDSGSDAPVMVEASRDVVDVKVAPKKSHNILSGVGSKVKHSISKVKKAITGKSSHPKRHSPR